jgi:hypothetical protein
VARVQGQAGLPVLTMKNHVIFGTILLLFTATAFGASEGDPLPSADAVVARMLAHNAQRQTQLAGYRGMRRYVLENNRMNKHAEMLVRVEGDTDETKHFEVVSVEGWKAAQKHVLQKMLDSEAEASSPEIRLQTRLSPENYELHMVRAALLGDRMAYVINVVPKRSEERLFEGQIWVDSQDYALARVEGKPAKNPSFWIHSVHFVHTYQKSGPFWFPVSTESVTQVRIFGSTSLTINYFDYTPNSLRTPETASAAPRGGFTP